MKKFTFAVLFVVAIITITGCFESSAKNTAGPMEKKIVKVVKSVSKEDATKKFKRELPDLSDRLMLRYLAGAEIVGISSNDLYSIDVAIMGATSKQSAAYIISKMAEYASLYVSEDEFKSFELLAQDSSWIRPQLFRMAYVSSVKAAAPMEAYLKVKHGVGPVNGVDFKDALGTLMNPFLDKPVEVYISYDKAFEHFNTADYTNKLMINIAQTTRLVCIVIGVEYERFSDDDKLALFEIATEAKETIVESLAAYASRNIAMDDFELLKANESSPKITNLKAKLWDVNSEVMEAYILEVNQYFMRDKD